MNIIIDTNIAFSILLNPDGKIGDYIFINQQENKYHSTPYLQFEINKHWSKIKKYSKLNDEQLNNTYQYLLSIIHFYDIILIPENIWVKVNELISNVDEDDIEFVALAIYLKGYLWTGDKKLYNGLKKNGFSKVYLTSDLIK